MKEAQRYKLLTLLLLLSLLTSGGTHQKDNRHIIGRPEIGTRSAEGNNFASTRKNRSHLALRQFLPGTSVAVLVTEAQSITIAAWSVLCNMLLQGLERCKFLEFGLTSNRLLRSICVEWEAQVQKSQVPAPRVNEKVTLCTENHELYIYVYIAWANSHQGQKGGVEWTGGISMTTRVPAVLKNYYISLWWKEAVACLILAPISEMVLAWEELPWADQISQEQGVKNISNIKNI